MSQQIPILFLLIIGLGILTTGVIGYFLGPLLLRFHNKIIGKKLIYGIQELKMPDKYRRTFYSFLPALMAVSLSMIFADNESVIDLLISQEYFDQGGTMELAVLLSFIILLPLTSLVSLIIFTPVWTLLESGIVYSNRNKVRNKMRPEEIDGVGSWYYKTIKGYVGIGAVVSYFRFIVYSFHAYDLDQGILESGALGALIFLPLLPLILMIFFIPAMIIFNSTSEKRRQNLLELAKKLRINQDLKELLI